MSPGELPEEGSKKSHTNINLISSSELLSFFLPVNHLSEFKLFSASTLSPKELQPAR